MNEKTTLLRKVLNRLVIARPVEPKTRRLTIARRKRSLVVMLKKVNAYRFSTRVKISFMLWGRRFHIRERKKRNTIVWGFASAAAACIVIAGSFFLVATLNKKVYISDRKQGAIVVFLTGSANITRPGAVAQPLLLNSVIRKGDVITTGEKSMAALQLGNKAVFNITENSRVIADSLIQHDATHVSLKKGTILSKIHKLHKGQSYKVSTKTVVASVRGTEFMVSKRPDRVTISLGKGKLGILLRGRKKETLFKEGTSVDVAGNVMKQREITRQEKNLLRQVSVIPFMKEIQRASFAKVKKHSVVIKNKIDLLNAEMKKEKSAGHKKTGKIRSTQVRKQLTLDDLRKKYGSLVKIMTKGGKVYIGYYNQLGNKASIITTRGRVIISGDNIKRVEQYK